MNSDEFYDLVREAAMRGSTLDGVLPHYCQAAVREIETMHSFRYMEWWYEFTMVKDATPITQPPIRFKDIEFLRFDRGTSDDHAKFEYLHRTTPREQVRRKGKPARYWTYRDQFIVIDAIPDDEYDFEALIHRFTEFPEEGSPDEHWLLVNGPNALLAKVMLFLSPFIREDDPRIMQEWRNQFNEGLTGLIRQDETQRDKDAPTEMEFWPEHIPYSKAWSE